MKSCSSLYQRAFIDRDHARVVFFAVGLTQSLHQTFVTAAYFCIGEGFIEDYQQQLLENTTHATHVIFRLNATHRLHCN